MVCLRHVLYESPLHLGTYALQKDMAWLARRHCSDGLQLDTHALRATVRTCEDISQVAHRQPCGGTPRVTLKAFKAQRFKIRDVQLVVFSPQVPRH